MTTLASAFSPLGCERRLRALGLGRPQRRAPRRRAPRRAPPRHRTRTRPAAGRPRASPRKPLHGGAVGFKKYGSGDREELLFNLPAYLAFDFHSQMSSISYGNVHGILQSQRHPHQHDKSMKLCLRVCLIPKKSLLSKRISNSKSKLLHVCFQKYASSWVRF